MNTVLSSYGQLCGCPEILKKSCKFFCRGLDIRVTQVMDSDSFYIRRFRSPVHLVMEIGFCDLEHSFIPADFIEHTNIFLHFLT